MKPKELAECHQTLSSWVGSGDKTRKHVDLDHVELFSHDSLDIIMEDFCMLCDMLKECIIQLI